MTKEDEPVLFKPRTIVHPPKKTLRSCARCGGGHASWWATATPPSCDEGMVKRHG